MMLPSFDGSPSLLAPVVEKGDAGQNHHETQRGAHRAYHPQVDGESNRSGKKDERRPGMSQSAVRPGQLRFLATQAEQGDGGQGEKNPHRKDEQGIELFVGAAEREQRRDRAKKDQRAAGRAKG